ncbi:intermembrane lipid transfer protein VPS13C-like isoform X3 [Symsagittifera roscoffensis]|uniref:intermembrane lipid transfer protein VPS13C-like isoform X3 n=1 Tax=Symsagittifera roscoffensis TaxID=84072 RepID=UPI00307C93AE
MLEGLLKWAVDYLLKDYVIIDPNSAKTNILEGKIEFENLELRPDILEKLGVSGYSLRAGHIGKLLVHISPFNYSSQPANVLIDGIYLLVVPSHVVKVDKATKTKRRVEDKLRTLAKIEEMRSQKLLAEDKDQEEQQNKKDGFLLRQVMAIVRNLQITVNNIHVRLEDGTTDPSCKVSLGVTLESLTLRTCNGKWEETLVTEQTSNAFFKVAKLRSLSLYFTTHSKLYSEQAAVDKNAMKGILKATIAKEGGRLPPAYEYLVKPLSSDARVWVVPNPRNCNPGQPQLFMDMVIHDVAIAASKKQVHSAIALVESADLLRMKNKYKKFRPKDLSSPKAKWDFAIKCVLVKTVRPKLDVWKWENIKMHRDTCLQYQEVMQKVYGKPNSKLTEQEEIKKAIAEETLDVFDLDLCRRLAQQAVKLTKDALAQEQKRKKQEKSSGGWFGWGSSSKKSSAKSEEMITTVTEEIEKGMNDAKNKAELYKALGYDDNEDSGMMNYSLLPKEFIQLEVGVNLKKFSVTLNEDIGGGVMHNVSKFSMTNLKTSLMRQPTPDYLKAKFDLGRLEIDGSIDTKADVKTTKPPQLLSIVQDNSKNSLITIVFEMSPLSNTDVDFAVNVRSESVQMTYDFGTVQNLVDFFKTKQEATLVVDDVKDAANRQMKKFSNTSTAGVLFLLEKHKVIFLDVNLEPSFALIPAKGQIQSDAPVVIFKTGQLKVVTQNTKSALRQAKATTASAAAATNERELARTTTMDEIKDKPYDRYNCTLSNVQLFYLEKSYNWKEIAFNPDSSESLVKPMVLTLELQKCMVMDDPEFPLIKVSGALEDLSVRISDLKMIHLMVFLDQMKFPKTDDEMPAASQSVPTGDVQKPSVSVYKGKQSDMHDVLQHVDKLDSLLPLGDSSGGGKTDFVPASKQLTLVKLKYTIHKASIILLEDHTSTGGDVHPLLHIELKRLFIGLMKKNYEIPIVISLQSVSIVHLQIKHGNENLKFLESKLSEKRGDAASGGDIKEDAESQMVEVKIRIAERKSPVFHSEYESVEFHVEAKLHSLAVRLHQEAILSALQFQKGLMERLFPEKQQNDKAGADNVSHQSLDVPQDQDSSMTRLEEDSRGQEMSRLDKLDQYNQLLSKERKTRLVQLQFWAHLGEIDLAISSDSLVDRDIATLRLEGLSSFVEVVPSETITFKSSMEKIHVMDTIENTVYPYIFRVSGNEVFSLDVIYYFGATRGSGYLDMDKFDLKVQLKTGTPRVVYVHRWVQSLIDFANHFQEEMKRFEEASSNALKNTADLAQTVYQKAFRIKLDLEILAPSVFIPKNSQAAEVIYANLGHMKIENKFKAVAVTGGNAILDGLTLKLKDVKVSRALLDDNGGIKAECHLLDPSVMEIDVVRNLTPLLKTDQSGIEINGKIVRLEAGLGQADVQMVYEILFGNFGEVVKAKPVPKKRPTSSSSRGRRRSRQLKTSKQSSRASSVQSRSGEKSSKVSNTGDASNEIEQSVSTEKLVTFKASFSIESVCAQLFSDRIELVSGLVKRDPRSNLAKFELLTMNVRMRMYSDEDMEFHANMMDCILDDSRKISTGAIVRMMERKKKIDSLSNSGDYATARMDSIPEQTREGSLADQSANSTYMIAIDYAKEGDEEKIDMLLNDMYLCVCTDFLLSVGDFFLKNKPVMSTEGDDKLEQVEKAITAPLETIQEEDDDGNENGQLEAGAVVADAVKEPEKEVTRIISVSFRNPEIVLVSDTRNDYSPCLILTWKVRSSIVMRAKELKLTALVTDIELICCPFKSSLRRGNTKQVIPKFNMQAFANQSESSKQQNMNIDVGELDINISPAVIKIMQAVAIIMSKHQALDEQRGVYGVTDALWAPKEVKSDDVAFLKAPVHSLAKITSVDAPSNLDDDSESAFLTVPRVTIKLDISDSTGITQPILLMESSLSVRINNYISTDRLSIVAETTLGVEYFNGLVNAWEPVVEPNRFVTDRGQTKSELWCMKTEIKHNVGESTPDSLGAEGNSAQWCVNISAQKSLQMTATSKFLQTMEQVQEAFASSFSLVYNDDQTCDLIGDMAPYAIVNESGRELSVLVPRDFSVIGYDVDQGPDDTSLVHMGPLDRIELAPNSNMSADKFKRLSTQGKFIRGNSMASCKPDADAEEDENLKVRFHIIVPGSQTINDVSLTKPGFHFYNILPVTDYRCEPSLEIPKTTKEQKEKKSSCRKIWSFIHKSISYAQHSNSKVELINHFPLERRFSLVVQNGLNSNGHQNVCTISSSLILQNHFDIFFEIFHKDTLLGCVEPRGKFGVPMEQAFYPLESQMFIKPRVKEGERARWSFSQKAIDWRVIKKNGGARRVLIEQCNVDPEYARSETLLPLRMILQLETIKFGTIQGRLQDTPHYVIHMKPTCILRNLSPYPIYHRVRAADANSGSNTANTRSYQMLAYGEQEVVYEAVQGSTKLDVDLTDQTDKRYPGYVTVRKGNQAQCITYGQWFDAEKSASLVMGMSWEFDESNFLVMSIFAPYWIVNRLERDLYIKRADDEKVLLHPRDFAGITLFTPSSKETVEKMRLCVRVDNTLFSDSLNIQAVGNAEVAVCPRRSGGDQLVGVTNTLSKMGYTKIIVITPNFILLNNTKYHLEYAQFFQDQDASESQTWKPLAEGGVVGFWPETQDIHGNDCRKKMQMMLRMGPSSTSKPFFISRTDDFLVRMQQIGCVHISVSVSESATTITVNTYFPGAAPAKLFNLTDRTILLWQNQKSEREASNSAFKAALPSFIAHHLESSSSSSSSESEFEEYDLADSPNLFTLKVSRTKSLSNDPAPPEKTYVLAPNTHMLFTWTDPTAQRLLCYKVDGQLTSSPHQKGDKQQNKPVHPFFDLQKDEFQEIQCGQLDGSGEGVAKRYYGASMLCRQQRVLVFTDDQCLATGTKYDDDYEDYCNVEQKLHETFTYDVSVELFGLGVSLVNNTVTKELPKEILYMGVTPTDVAWFYWGKGKRHWTSFTLNSTLKIEEAYQSYLDQVRTNADTATHQVTINIGGGSHTFDFSKSPIQLLKPDKRKIKRTYLHGISIQYQQSPNVTHFHFKMNRLQVDDPLPTCMFPVVFAPVPPPRSIVGDREPAAFIQASVVMQRGSGQLLLFKYCKVLIQEFAVKIDTTFLGALQMFFKGNQIKTNVKQYLEMDVDLAHTQLADTEAVQIARGTQRHYYQDLNLGPIKMLLSLSLARGENDTALLPIDNSFLDGLTQTLGVVLTEQHDTCIKLSYFERKNRFMTVKQLTNQAQKFYTNQIVKQFYFFFANLDALGNPQKLFLGIKEGGTDLFYEPYQGAILGPQEFVEGLGIGVKSLGSHAIGGVFGVASSVTASAGQAIAFLSFDEKHKQERRNDMRDKPQHVGQGLTKGFKRFGSGVLSGVTGVITQPIQGVKKDGAKGLVTGIGKGAAGLVVKPVGGVVDLASNTFEGIRGSADDAVIVHLLRTPRVVRADCVVRPYDSYEARGNAILAALRVNQRYNSHAFTNNKSLKGAIIVTNRGIIHAEKRALVTAFERWEVVSQYAFKDIQDLPENNLDDDQFRLKLNSGNTKVLSVQPANKKFLRERTLEAHEDFVKMRASSD